MNVAFRKVWRDLWNNKARTMLVVASIAIGVLCFAAVAVFIWRSWRQLPRAGRSA